MVSKYKTSINLTNDDPDIIVISDTPTPEDQGRLLQVLPINLLHCHELNPKPQTIIQHNQEASPRKRQ